MIKVGDIIEFTPSYETTPIRATVVKCTRYPHCPGANTLTVFSDRDDGSPRNLFVMASIAGYGFLVEPAADEVVATARVEQAMAAYKACLAKYPVWRERFARGYEVSW
jgi:hypothetical protein